MDEVRANLLGTLAVKAGLATREQVDECLNTQQEARTVGGTVPRLGEVMAEKGYLSREQVDAILRGDFAEPGKRFGELCTQMRFVSSEQVVAALAEQDRLRGSGTIRRIGSIMVEQGSLKPHQVPAVLSAQGFEIAECSKCRLSYNVSVNAPGSALKCARCGRDLIMVTGYEDMEETEIGGEIREVPLGAAAEEPVASEEVAPPAAAPQPPASEAPTLEMSTPAPAAEAAPAEAPPTAPVPPAAAPPAVAEEVSPEELRKAAPEDVGPQIFGEFSTLGKIGEDSLGILYRGKHVATNQAVTLKVIDLSHTRDKAFVERFVGETKKAAGLSHANMKRVIAAGSDKGHLYYASEFVEGNSVRQLIRSEGRVSIRAATRIVRAVADALRYAHARGVFHGDIRPSYIMVGPDGKVKLAETGVA
ncbi:MAG: serine/threonine protein kinase, partial [Planctomycetota bacterium]